MLIYNTLIYNALISIINHNINNSRIDIFKVKNGYAELIMLMLIYSISYPFSLCPDIVLLTSLHPIKISKFDALATAQPKRASYID